MEKELDYGKVTYLYSAIPIILIVHLISIILFSLMMWHHVDEGTLGVWIAVSTIVLIFRLYHYTLFANSTEQEVHDDATIWLHRYYTYILIAGGLWGSTAVLFFPQHEILHQMIVILFILGITATAIGIISASWYLVVAFALLSFTPLILRLAWLQDTLYQSIAYIVSALGILMILTAKHFGAFIDVSLQNRKELFRAKNDLRALKDQFIALLENAPVGIFYYDKNLQITDINSHMAAIMHLDGKEDMIGYDLNEIADKRIENALKSVFENRQGSYTGAFYSLFNDHKMYIQLQTIPLFNDVGEFNGAIGIFKDFTAETEAKEAIRQNAFYDSMTKLPNRILFSDRLSLAIEQSKRHNFKCAVLFLDLDHFKHVNDHLGHFIGDQLLYTVSQRLLKQVRAEDTVARIGGDEFLILLNALPEENEEAEKITMEIASDLIDAVNEPYKIEEHELRISVSIGAYIFPAETDDTPASIIKHADIAMYQAKRTGRSHAELYHEDYEIDQQEVLSMEMALRSALENSEFVLYFQPKVSFKSSHIEQVEALIRWRHPEKGLLLPDAFIPFAEQNGMILKIGEWVFEESVRQIKAWHNNGNTVRIDSVSINVSNYQFNQPDFVDYIKSVIMVHDIEPRLIELELTESVMVDNATDAIDKIKALEAYGIKIALDDFGTGYSSLSYLKHLPVSVIKIDRSFIMDLKQNKNSQMIVKTIIAIAKSLDLTVVAEGVESEEELQILQELECDFYQGFYYAKAVPASELNELMERET